MASVPWLVLHIAVSGACVGAKVGVTTHPIPNCLHRFPVFCRYMGNNRFSGTICASISKLDSLTDLYEIVMVAACDCGYNGSVDSFKAGCFTTND